MKKMRLKKSKKKYVPKTIIFILIIFLSFTFSFKHFMKKEKIKKEEYVDFLLTNSYDKKTNYKFIFNESLKFLTKLDFSKPETLLDNKLNPKEKIKEKEEEEVFSKEDNYKIEDYEKITSYINNTSVNNTNPTLYIYNTHQLETYSNIGIESTSINPNVMMSAYLLRDKLTSLGIPTIVEDTNMAEFIKNSGITHNQFYGSSRLFMQNAMKKYPSLKYYIDLHRDSIPKNISTTSINGKNYARVLFVIGTSNKSYEENERVVKKISDMINSEYPKLSRGVYERYVDDWPEAYNQDLSKNSMLIELGAKENTIDEVMNTIDALSKILGKYIKENN